jgi:hypothetical protein
VGLAGAGGFGRGPAALVGQDQVVVGETPGDRGGAQRGARAEGQERGFLGGDRLRDRFVGVIAAERVVLGGRIRYERYPNPFGAFLSLAATLICYDRLTK